MMFTSLPQQKNIKIFNAVVKSALTGKIVFQWNSIGEGWDWNDSLGKNISLGRYLLSIQAVGNDGKAIQENLVITLY